MCSIPESAEETTEMCENGGKSCEFRGKKFNGNPRNYHWFMESFERYIHENNVDAATSIHLLTESCVGRARERIETFKYVCPKERALKIALHTLKLHYGKQRAR